MILKAKHHFILDPLLRLYVIHKMNRAFHSVVIKGDTKDKNLPVLFIGNHISWWDGIWVLHINQKLFKRKFFYMMEEEQLRKNWFLNYSGGYSITKNSRSIIESINYTAELLTDRKNLVLLFPQGVIVSMYNHEFVFQKGITKIFHQINNKVQVVFLANFIDYHSNTKPTVYSFLKNYYGEYELSQLQESYNAFYQQCLNEQKKLTT